MILRVYIVLILSGFFTKVQAQYTDVYNVNWQSDRYIAVSLAALLTVDYIWNTTVDPLTISEINELSIDDIPSFDRSAASNFNEASADVSDYFRDGINFVPLVIMLTSNGRKEYKAVTTLFIQAFLANRAITSTIKLASGRIRPYAYNPNAPLELKTTKFSKRSFISGHTSNVSTLAFFTASVLDDLYPEKNLKYLYWPVLAAIPAVTGYLRYDAGRHFPSDVIVGYLVGGAIGYFVPKLHHHKKDSSVNLQLGMGGARLVWEF